MYAIEQMCRDICSASNNMCTVFAIYDVNKDNLDRFRELRQNTAVLHDYTRLDNVIQEEGTPYWYLTSQTTLETNRKHSILAIEILERLQACSSKVAFPDIWSDQRFGNHNWNLDSAAGAMKFSIQWHHDMIDAEEKTFFYTTEEYRVLLGKVEERVTITLQEVDWSSPDHKAFYTGEWRVGR